MNIKKIKELLKTKTVGIAGCGGLGSNSAVALARVGVGKLIIADFDLVDASNLNRQYYFHEQIGQQKVFALADNLYFVNPSVQVEPHDVKLGPDEILLLFRNCDLIIEAFDAAEAKQMIVETVLSGFPDKTLILGNGMAGWGKSNLLKTEKIDQNLYVCGDGISEISEDLPPLAPRVAIVANMQANLALQLLLNNFNNMEI
nr:sulfur carrier protein ThiS adenylyltransferase ThiF [Bacteroidota bacterium]